jgi:hypothetical protein
MADETHIGEELEVKVKPALLPFLPASNSRGGPVVEVTNLVFPLPPLPPLAATRVSPSLRSWNRSSEVSRS